LNAKGFPACELCGAKDRETWSMALSEENAKKLGKSHAALCWDCALKDNPPSKANPAHK